MGCVQQKSQNKVKRVERRSMSTMVIHTETHAEIQSQFINLTNRKLQGNNLTDLTQQLARDCFFSNFHAKELAVVCEYFVSGYLLEGEYLFEKGDYACSAFFLESGQIQLLNQKSVIYAGTLFGVGSFFFPAQRTDYALAKTRCQLWLLNKKFYSEIKQLIANRIYGIIKPFVNFTPALSALTPEQKNQLSKHAILLRYQPGDFITKEGEEALTFGLIIYGQVSVLIGGKQVNVLKHGSSFGENSLLPETSNRGASLRAMKETRLFLATREEMRKLLNYQTDQLFHYNSCLWALQKSSKLRAITFYKKDKIIKGLSFRKVAKGEVLVQKGKEVNEVIFAIGTGLVYEKGIVVCHAGEVFGDIAVSSHFQTMDRVLAIDAGLIATINVKKLNKIAGRMEQVISKQKFYERQRRFWSNFVGVKDLKVVQTLPRDRVSLGFVVAQGRGKELVQLKCVSRKLRKAEKSRQEYLLSLGAIGSLGLSLLPRQLHVFRDQDFHYFFYSYRRSVRFSWLMRRDTRLSFEERRFILSVLLLGVQHLHAHEVLVRQLYSENLLVQEDGYLSLLNIGQCKLLRCSREYRASTRVGPIDCYPPEVVQGSEYSFAADIWQVGLLFYECIAQHRPFQHLEDPMQVFKSIAQFNQDTIRFPSFKDELSYDILKWLLCKDPEKRLKFKKYYRTHRLFAEFSHWEELKQRQIISPIRCQKLIEELNAGQSSRNLEAELKGLRGDHSIASSFKMNQSHF